MNALHRHQQRGLSLVELMVAMVIGIAVVSVLIVNYLSGANAGRLAQMQAQMSEDAQFALNLLARDLREGGYNNGDATLGRGGFVVFACDSGFSNGVVDGVSGATSVPTMDQLTCATGTSVGTTTAIAVAYLADTRNTSPTADTPPKATDCTRAGLVAGQVVENRYFISNNSLRCAGSAPNASGNTFVVSQALVPNIEALNLQFGMASANKSTAIAGYVTSTAAIGPANGSTAPTDTTLQALNADAIGTPTPAPISVQASRWRLVRAVRLCVRVRSESAVVGDAAQSLHYVDCDGNLKSITDGRLRRTFSTTVMLRNLP